MRYFIFREILGLVLQAVCFKNWFSTSCAGNSSYFLNENLGCPNCFPYNGLGREVPLAEAHNLQENLGGFFLSSYGNIKHQGNTKN